MSSRLFVKWSVVAVLALFAGRALATDTCNPCIDLTKTGPAAAQPGDVVTYTFTVTNCGDVLLGSGAYVYDDLFGAAPIWSGNLLPGETMTFTREYTLPDVCGDFTNTARALGVPDESVAACAGVPNVTDTDSHTIAVACVPESPGTGTPGYWKNHPEAWPVASITIGGVAYTREAAIAFMQTPVVNDKTFTMFAALVSAKLNVMIGNDASCIAATITAADNWMTLNGPVGSGVRAASAAWGLGEPLYLQLNAYNNGLLCAPHRT
ncbi:MAG TPA: hypothetical protein VFP50_01070 [Anaeromyxobacteraceae bacterium]|nr:hypothetical protein [Anaeromyxobacteraceae bacterium]